MSPKQVLRAAPAAGDRRLRVARAQVLGARAERSRASRARPRRGTAAGRCRRSASARRSERPDSAARPPATRSSSSVICCRARARRRARCRSCRSTPRARRGRPRARRGSRRTRRRRALTSSTWSACETNSTRPTLSRWRRDSGGPSRSRAAAPRPGRRAARNSVPIARKKPASSSRLSSGMSLKTCHSSVVRNRITAPPRISGTARASRTADAPSSPTSRTATQRMIDSSAVADDAVDQREQHQVARRGHERALPLAAEDQRQQRRARARTARARPCRRRCGRASDGAPAQDVGDRPGRPAGTPARRAPRRRSRTRPSRGRSRRTSPRGRPASAAAPRA